MDDQDDPPLDAAALEAVAALGEHDLLAIDAALLASVNEQWQKLAFVVAEAMLAYPDRYFDIPDLFYAERVKSLVSRGVIEARGRLARMRFSEIRRRCPASGGVG